jgi:hypothetical protein
VLFDCPLCGASAGTECGHGPNRERLALVAAVEGVAASNQERHSEHRPPPPATPPA